MPEPCSKQQRALQAQGGLETDTPSNIQPCPHAVICFWIEEDNSSLQSGSSREPSTQIRSSARRQQLLLAAGSPGMGAQRAVLCAREGSDATSGSSSAHTTERPRFQELPSALPRTKLLEAALLAPLPPALRGTARSVAAAQAGPCFEREVMGLTGEHGKQILFTPRGPRWAKHFIRYQREQFRSLFPPNAHPSGRVYVRRWEVFDGFPQWHSH